MIDYADLIHGLGLAAISAPFLLLGVLGIASLLSLTPSERTTGRLCHAASVVGLLASFSSLALMLIFGGRRESIDLGDWVVIPDYHFSVKLIFDRLSVPFVILSFMLCGTIA